MLHIIISGVLLIACIVTIIISNKIADSAQNRLYDIRKDIRDLEYLDRSLTDTENTRYRSLLRQSDKLENKYDAYDNLKDFLKYAIAVPCAWLGFALIILVCNINPYSVKKSNIENLARYNTIITELERSDVRDAFNIRMKDVIDDARDWNIDYDNFMVDHNNPWTNIYNPLKEYEGTNKIDIDNYI